MDSNTRFLMRLVVAGIAVLLLVAAGIVSIRADLVPLDILQEVDTTAGTSQAGL